MSDNSFDSDSEEDEEVDVIVPPKITYESLSRHSNTRQQQTHLSESRRKFPENTKKDGGPTQFQNHTRKSNFPPNFDERYKAMNFVASSGSQSKKQKHPHVNIPNAQVSFEHGTTYPQSFNQQNWQQNSQKEYPHDVPSLAINPTLGFKQQKINTLTSKEPMPLPGNEYMSDYSQSSRRPRQSSVTEYMNDHSQSSQRSRQPSENEHMNYHSQSSQRSRQPSENEHMNYNSQSSQRSRQPSENEYMNDHSQSSQRSRQPSENEHMNDHSQSSQRPRQPSENEHMNDHSQSIQRPRQPSENEHMMGHSQSYSRASLPPPGTENMYAHSQTSRGPSQPSRNEFMNAHSQSFSHVSMSPPGKVYMKTQSQSTFRDAESPAYTSHRPQGSYPVSGFDRRPDPIDLPSGKSFGKSSTVSYNKLLEWSTSGNNTLLIFDINFHLDGLSRMLKQDSIKYDWMQHLIVILKKIITTESQKATLHYILKRVCESKFLQVHLDRFILELQQKTNADIYGYFQKLVDVLEYVTKNLKAYTVYCKQSLQSLLDVGKRLNILSDRKDLAKRVQHLLQHTHRGDIHRSVETPMNTGPNHYQREKSVPMPDDEEPPDEYFKMTIFPNTDELVASVEPFLRANKTKGAYRDILHYLDIHSRLMKEDYLSPIRTGLKNFKTALQSNKAVKEDNLRFYYNVKIVQISFDSDEGITHFITFDKSPFEEIEWEFSKRLMFGSLLVFSKDNFESTIFATVANRDVEKLKRGILEVMFQNNLEEVFTSSENDIFIMAETTAYFESYRHVLEGLQEMTIIPLERYIISCCREINTPRYLGQNMCYNIASIMNKVFDNYPVPVLDDHEWPMADSTLLNGSQLEAVKLALTKEMAIIQGPPGTGKTYVGLKIMRIILENKVMKNVIGSKGPVLVVCFTNHALDQFLEGILEFCQIGIVRVGGRSSSELLEKYNLKKLRQNPSLPPKMKIRIQENVQKFRRQLKAVGVAINRHWQEVLRLETTILNVQDLVDEMSDKHEESLTDPRRQTSTNIGVHAMSTWLKASNANMDNHLNKAAKSHLGKVIAKGGDIMSDSSLANQKSALKLDFQSRVKIYHYWIKKYETFIEEEIEKLASDGGPENERQLGVLLDAKEELNKDILPDDILQPYMGEKVYKSIKESVKLELKSEVEKSSFVQHWLLDRVGRTDQLLDAIEQLIAVKPVAKQSQGRGRTLTGNEASGHKDRWVIDDSDNSEASSQESDDDEEDDTGENGDHNDGGKVKMSDIKELENSYKQFKDKEIVMLQRAKMLGIDLIDRQEMSEQWQTVNTMSYSKVFSLYHSSEAYTEEEASTITDLWNLQLRDRYRLYKYWVQKRKDKLTSRLIDLTDEYKVISKCKKEAYSVRDIAILNKARVIGMTTTGAARHRAVLQEVGCRIIVVEEAAEVLEAHIVTTLNSKCQHLILIGDHQQLRPSPTVHKLAVDYDLEISLFERMVKNNIPKVTLTEQHRMRPEISEYLQHIYPNLQDHISVMRYEDIKGVCSNVFFIQHDYRESGVDDTTSKANLHEARFITGLCKYFMQHEYLSNQITVLAAYSGQVKTIRDEMELEESLYEHVRVTSIDNYQGEENDIVLLSLVRSNEENDVGFLKNDNRVCVALSRAKMGLFVIGNFQQLALKSNLWRNIVSTAKENRVFGIGMKMVCVNHNHITYIVNPEDFEKEVPEGGCNKPCKALLSCGHNCTRMCHSSDLYHETTKCMMPCLKKCPDGHQCQKDCYEECGQCEVRVLKKVPWCGHEDQVPCYLDVDEVICSRNCGEKMACGHICRGRCGVCNDQGTHQPCLEKIDLEWPCGHKSNVECQTDIAVDPCPSKCSERLECGHKCRGTCGGCLFGRVHRACAEKCKRPLPCGHACEGPCGVTCLPCKLRCPTSCRHGPCGKSSCGDLCEPCTENCAMVCQHRKCTGLCFSECAQPPCSKTCNIPTACKHKCMSLCGEACVCYNCEKANFGLIDTSTKKKSQWVVAHEKQERAKKFEIEKDTILMKIPKCKHIFTLTQLDRYIESYASTDTSFIRCPTCSAPIQGISRYEAINQHLAERRENKKEDIIQNTKVPNNKLLKIIDSKLVVNNFCIVDEGEFLSRKPDLVDANHALALTMQIRFAFALNKIGEIHKKFNQEVEFKIRKWKNIVSSIQHSMPPQLITEMTMELYRLLLCEQVTFLNKTLKNLGITLKDEIKSSLGVILKDLRKQQKLTIKDKQRIQITLDSLYEEFYRHSPSEEWSADAKNMQGLINTLTIILDQPPTEDLITILRQNNPQELTAHSTKLLEVDSETDESDDYCEL